MNGNGFFNPFGSPGSSGGGGGGGTSEKVRYSISKVTNESTGEVTYKLMQSLNNGAATAVGEVIGVRGSQILVTYNNQQVLLDTAIANIEQLLDKTYNFTTFSELNIDTHNKTLTEITNELIAKNLPTNTIVTGQLYSNALPFSGNGEAEVLVNHPAYWWKCGSLNVAPYSWTAITGSSVWGDNGLVMDWTPSNFTLPTASADTLGGIKVGSGLSIDGSGVLSADGYTLPTASVNTLGGIKVGEGLEMTEGVLSVIAGPTYTAGNGIEFVDGSVLPSGYTPVEYLHGTGQCIRNLYATNGSTFVRIETEFACDTPSSGEWDIIGGGGDPQWANIPILILQTAATINGSDGHNNDVTVTDYQIGAWLYNTYVLSGVTPSINTFHKVVAEWNNGTMTITVDDVSHTYSCQPLRSTILTLFSNGPGVATTGNIKMKYLKIYQGDSPARDLIPAKNSSNVYGMYDLVSGTFFTKTDGDGDFSGGDAITLPSSTVINVTPATSVAIGGVIVGSNINVDANGTISVDKTIKTIAKTSTSGLVDSYRITFNDNTYFDFTVTNGANGADGQDGSAGAPGQDGDDGVSITGAAIDNTGHLIITLSEGPSIDAGMAKGADGTSVTILDSFSSTADLPSTGQHNGDGYLINGDLWVYTGGTDPGMVNGFKDVGTIQGPAGRSITAVSISQGDLYITFSDNPSTPVYIGPIKGDKGDTGNTGPQGPDGKSAYQVWLDAGNVGTVSDYLNSLVGAQGNPGPAGKGIASIQKSGTSGLVDTYTITYTDTTSGTFTVTNGADGSAGATGNGISSIAKTGTSGLVDTYTITFTNGTDATFTVTNGADGSDGANGATGNGIASIAKTGTSGLVDTYTITYTNGGEATFTVTNGANGRNGTNGTNGADGNGIVSITKTGTVDLTDSYRITFTDGGHFDFTITNGANGTNGTNGTNGADGVSITGTTIDNDGHLQVTNSNNQTTDAGSVRLFSTQINFVMAANSWTTLSNGDYEYTYSNASITADKFIDFGPALNITEEQLNALLGSKLILESISNGSVVFKAYGEVPSVDIPMLLVIEGSFQQVEPQITVDTTLSTASTNPVENRAIANGFAAVQSELNDADVSYNKASIGSMTLGSHYSAIKRSDGTILASADGSQRGSTGTLQVNIDNVIPAGTYYLSGCHGGSSSTYYLNLRAKSGGTLLATCYGTPAQFTLNADTEVYAEIVATGGVVLTDQMFDIMIKDASVADTTFHKSSIGATPIVACGHETLDIIFGDKDHYICQVYVINAQGQLTQFIMLNVNCDLRLYVSNIITDNTGSGQVNATINFINGENAIRIQEINSGNPRDIIVYAIGY